MNYGAIGVVVGHEITHGFDDTGSQKDGDGNLVDWWEPQTKKKYLERAQCIIGRNQIKNVWLFWNEIKDPKSKRLFIKVMVSKKIL